MSGNAALYQVAIALIPGLLFGGATLQLREEGPGLPRSGWVRLGIAALLCAGVLAEIFAIRGAIDPSISDLEQRWIVFMLTTGTVGVAYWCALPLLSDESGGTRLPFGQPLLLLLLLGAAVAGQFAITESLQNAQARVRFEEVSDRHERFLRETQSAEAEHAEARAHLIDLARSSHSSDRLLAVVLSRLGRLDDGPLSLARSDRLDSDTVGASLDRAFDSLNRIDDRLEAAIMEKVPNLSEAERQLLYLAERRLISAVAEEMVSISNRTVTDKEFDRACAELPGCSIRP